METKKNELKYFLFVLLILLSTISTNYGQLKVMISEGENFYTSADSEWMQIQVNQTLDEKYKIQLGEKSLLVLFNEEGSFIELENGNEESIYLVRDLVPESDSLDGFLSTFMKYIASEITSNTIDFRDTIPGAVERSSSPIKLLNSNHITIIDNNVKFKWQNNLGENDFIFTIKDISNDTIAKLNVKNSFYNLNLESLNLREDEFYFCMIESKVNKLVKSDEFCIKILNKNEIERINYELSVLKKYSDQSSSDLINTLLFAKFYEKNNLIDKAYDEYSNFYNKENKIDSFNKEFYKFLLNNGFIYKAREVYQSYNN